MKLFYPVLSFFARKTKGPHFFTGSTIAPVPFHTLKAVLNDGSTFSFMEMQGKKVLVVNTASDCGYTAQYEGLQRLSEAFPSLMVLIFPSNDFKNQERGTDEEIAAFCKVNYGLSLPIFKKCIVKKAPGQNEVFAWLTNAELNGWNNNEPFWNFNKYLVSEKGNLTHVFDHTADPLSKEIIDVINL